MNKNIKFLSVAMLVIAIAGGYYFPKVQQTEVQQTVQNVLGAVASLDGVDNPYVTINGHREWRGTIQMTATSSVICDFSNPFTSTSSVEMLSAVSTNTGIAAANNLTNANVITEGQQVRQHIRVFME